jgi:rhamnosyltransferase
MKTGCILVLYNPDIDLLRDVISSIEYQLDKICIIDNSLSSLDDLTLVENKKTKYIALNRNVGIAAAQNIGLEYFIEEKYDYILFADQDSIMPNNLVANLHNATFALMNNGYRVAVVCPTSINRQDGKPYKEKYPIFDNISLQYKENEYDFFKVNSCGSSASLISIKNFNEVGLMDVQLFIDGVDNEWCWRAKAKCNLDSFILLNTGINHQLGEGDKSFFGFKIAISTPFRIYYQFRNYIILSRRDYVPRVWKYKNGYKYLIKFLFLPLFISPRIIYLKSILSGIKDGIKLENK